MGEWGSMDNVEGDDLKADAVMSHFGYATDCPTPMERVSRKMTNGNGAITERQLHSSSCSISPCSVSCEARIKRIARLRLC